MQDLLCTVPVYVNYCSILMNSYLCSYRATLYPCPESAAERREMTMGVSTRIEDLRTVI